MLYEVITEHALRFEESLPDDDDDDTPVGTSATRVLSTNDVRQVTTYAELLRIGHESPPSDVAILYPFVVITSYSIHYTKLYEATATRTRSSTNSTVAAC